MSSSAASAVPSSSSAGQATTTQISLHGLTMSPKIRPFAKWCLFEAAGGICRDNSCFSMHLRDISFDDRELLADLCSYTRGETLEEQVNYTRQIVDILRSDQDVKTITQKLLEFQANCQLDVSQSIVFNKRNTRVRHLLSTVLSKKNADKQAADKRAKQPVKSDVKVVLANSSPILPILPPIQLAMLQNAMTNQNSNKSNKQDGKDGSTSNRYYSQEQYTTEQYESMVTQHPDRIDLWIAYAQHLLPSPLTMDILRAPGTQLDDTLRILSRALSVCPASEALWNMYLEFMMRRGDIGAVQNLIEHALRYTSMAWCIRWRHYLWEEGSNKKHAILGDMTKDLFDSNQLDVQQRSQRLLDVLVQLVSLVLKEKGADTAIYTLFRLIACTERADFISLMSMI
ncbi:hypothetical protein BDF22DRAFT_511211 [Syncephalis plumigaleata]|nr:hypothetical protein BDF22DRAFT_511211 [Syncephalis plumigaleata]